MSRHCLCCGHYEQISCQSREGALGFYEVDTSLSQGELQSEPMLCCQFTQMQMWLEILIPGSQLLVFSSYLEGELCHDNPNCKSVLLFPRQRLSMWPPLIYAKRCSG